MEQTRPNDFAGANFKTRIVKRIVKPTKSISYKVSVKAALGEMLALAIDSVPVTDERGELLGTLSKSKMNRNVGGLGHDPETEPVAAHIQTDSGYCFEDQTIEEAEGIMLQAKIAEVPVVTGEKLLVGTINLKAVAREKDGGDSVRPGTNPAPENGRIRPWMAIPGNESLRAAPNQHSSCTIGRS